MVSLRKQAPRRKQQTSLGKRIYAVLLATSTFLLMFVFSSLDPFPVVERRGPPIQLASPNNTKVSTDVRGNLGPPGAMVRGGTDWLKDRWQAASDMHGTAIQGHHQVLLGFHFPLDLDGLELDWEAAYSKDYLIEGAQANMVWFTLYDTRDTNQDSTNLLEMGPERKEGQSPGVKDPKVPLHVIHPFKFKNTTDAPQPPRLQYLKLTIRSSAMGWGVSLWRIQVFGWPVVPTTKRG